MVAASVPAVYAAALLQAADEAGSREPVVEDCGVIAEALHDNPQLIDLIESPQLSRDQAKELIAGSIGDAQPLVRDFLHLLIDRNRFDAAPAIFEELSRQVDASAGVVQVEVSSAAELTAEQRQQLSASLTRALGDGVVLTTRVDESLIGGIRVRAGDRVLDASVSRQLAAAKQAMLAAPTPAHMWANEGETA